MKITCPLCAQEGKAPDTITGKKVRCSGCEKVFRVTDNLIIEELPEGVAVCSKCGFAFSDVYTQKHDSAIFCAICAQTL